MTVSEPTRSPSRNTAAPGVRHIAPPRLYVYFDAIARHGSIRRAAEALHIASSALTRRLLDLERDMGATLFDRLQAGVRLTPAGEVFAAHVRRTLSDLRIAGEQLDALEDGLQGLVAIGSAESAAIALLPQAMTSLQRDHPSVRFALEVGTPRRILLDLVEDRVDLILTHEMPARQDVLVLASARKTFCAIMRLGHPLAGRDSLTLRDCQDYPAVIADETLAARGLVEDALALGAVQLRPVLVTNMFEAMKHYVRLTDAISFQFHLGDLADTERFGLAAIRLTDASLAQASLMLAVRRGRTLSTAAAAMRDTLHALLLDFGAL